MGTWGMSTFEDDDACDWLADFRDSPSIDMLDETFDMVLEIGDDYLERTEGACGVAAAEVVAALLGNPAPDLPEEIQKWVVGKAVPSSDLSTKARRVVERVLADDSEKRESWLESADALEWEAKMNDLLRRLGKVPL